MEDEWRVKFKIKLAHLSPVLTLARCRARDAVTTHREEIAKRPFTRTAFTPLTVAMGSGRIFVRTRAIVSGYVLNRFEIALP
jgi:hypothetical protein